MRTRHTGWPTVLLVLLSAFLSALLWAPALVAHAAPAGGIRLPMLGAAPEFVLDSARGSRVALADLRGKVVVVTFVFTTCNSSCPILTAKLADIGRSLGSDFGRKIAFVAISVDPGNDTPTRLLNYAAAYRAAVPGWHFLTGTPKEIDSVVRNFGSFAKQADSGSVNHLFLTSLIDRTGMLRVQYLGTRFDPREMQRDIEVLSHE
jgi:protein SCO1/2